VSALAFSRRGASCGLNRRHWFFFGPLPPARWVSGDALVRCRRALLVALHRHFFFDNLFRRIFVSPGLLSAEQQRSRGVSPSAMAMTIAIHTIGDVPPGAAARTRPGPSVDDGPSRSTALGRRGAKRNPRPIAPGLPVTSRALPTRAAGERRVSDARALETPLFDDGNELGVSLERTANLRSPSRPDEPTLCSPRPTRLWERSSLRRIGPHRHGRLMPTNHSSPGHAERRRPAR